VYIIIAGGGMVGGSIVRQLAANKHDLVVIDKDQNICDALYTETGVVAITGSAARIDVLKSANIEKANVAVATTENDADNLAFTILAKSFGVPEVIVRMRDPAYENAYQVAGVNAIIRVTDLMVNQMIMEIEKPRVRRISSIGEGKADIFRVIVPVHAKVAGKNIQEIAQDKRFPSECVFIAVYNREKEEFYIPRGNRIVNEGDELFMVSSAKDIKQAADFLTAAGRTTRAKKRTG